MNTGIRRQVFLSIAALQGVLAAGFVLQAGWAQALWPWQAGRLSLIFLGSVLAAFAVGGAWTGLTGRWRGALAALVAVAAVMLFLALALWLGGAAWPWPMACLVTGLGAAVNAAEVARLPGRGRRLAAWPRLSCAIFAAALLGAALALILGAPHVFPWPLAPTTARAFGAIFLGLSLAYGLSAWWADRDMALVAMLGFLAYDLVLLPPFLAHFGTVKPEHLLSLTVYVAVLVYSAIVAMALLWQDRTEAP